MIPFFQSACTPIGPENEAFGSFTNAFSREIEREYGFQTFGVGASMPGKIYDIRLCFMANYPADVDQARKITVPLTLKFIQRMNEDENLMKYMANTPASLKNVNLTVAFKENFSGCLQSVMIIGSRNLVVYNKHNESGTALDDLHEETFYEAVNILRQSTPQ